MKLLQKIKPAKSLMTREEADKLAKEIAGPLVRAMEHKETRKIVFFDEYHLWTTVLVARQDWGQAIEALRGLVAWAKESK